MRLLPYPTGRALFLLLVEMILAVLQLRDAQRDRLGALMGVALLCDLRFSVVGRWSKN
jgi:hypothetical protein